MEQNPQAYWIVNPKYKEITRENQRVVKDLVVERAKIPRLAQIEPRINWKIEIWERIVKIIYSTQIVITSIKTTINLISPEQN